MGQTVFNCLYCKEEFKSYNKKAKYCSYACRNMGGNYKALLVQDSSDCQYCGKTCISSNLNRHEKVCLSYNRTCKMCKKDFRVTNVNRRNVYCSQSCSTTFNNSNKKSGIRRSKLEFFLEAQLISLYPKVDIQFNKITDMGFELDIHIPTLNLAFEINGIVHYKNIYGQEKYERTKNNDRNKMVKCYERDITLVVLDTMEQHKFTEESSARYLDTVCKIINLRLSKKKKPSK